MRFRTWPVAAAGLAGLLLLVIFSVVSASRRGQEIYAQLDRLNNHHQEVEDKLRQLRGDVHVSGIYVRDYLLDTARENAPEYRETLTELRTSSRDSLAQLRRTAGRRGEDEARMASLDAKLEEYWKGLEPLFDWTVYEKIVHSARFIRNEVLPRREAVLSIATEIEELNNANLAAQREELKKQAAAFRSELYTLLWRSLLLGLLVAIPAVIRLRVLEARSDQQTAIAREAEGQMRQLSQQLVAAQEEERRKISRELHDHVGQTLTALRMELGRIDRLRGPATAGVSSAVAEARHLVDDMVHTVRDLALGLRPSMLDDLGLQPALEWLARDFTRRSNVPVTLEVSGDLAVLSDAHRTCVYRIVQEALTNCVRHADARNIAVTVQAAAHELSVSVSDDGVGLDPARRSRGFGLRGIEERARELGGTVMIRSARGHGSALSIRLPLESEEPQLASATG